MHSTDAEFEMLERHLQGESLEEIARFYRVTRERIRQRIARAWGELGYEGSPASASLAARNRLTLYEKFAERATRAVPCRVCGYWVLRRQSGANRTCDSRCSQAWVSGRYHLDPDYRDRHRASMAGSILKRPEKYRPALVGWANRMLSPSPPQRNRRSWLVQGSRASEAVRLAEAIR